MWGNEKAELIGQADFSRAGIGSEEDPLPTHASSLHVHSFHWAFC